MNQELKCVVDSCIYNRSEHCGALAIKVRGDNPTNSEETFCSTFHQRNEEIMSDLPNSYFKSGITLSNIDEEMNPYLSCSVRECKFNHQERVCTATEVVVAGNNPAYPTETCCSTFRP